jgi:hypothetical protein
MNTVTPQPAKDDTQDLRTEWVFIDTCAFRGAGFDWDGPVLSSFKRLCGDQTLYLLTTSIIEREMHSQIADKISSSIVAYESSMRKAINSATHFDKSSRERLSSLQKGPALKTTVDEAIARQKRYFHECRAEFLDINDIPISQILDDYFFSAPPFGGKDKKSEFPDAINIAALNKHAYKNKHLIYVVSSDGDLASCCDDNGALIHVEKLEQLVSVAQAERDTRTKVANFILDSSAKILSILKLQFPDRGFYLSDADGELDDVEVISCEPLSTYILGRDRENFEVEVEGSLEFSATASWSDHTRATYDREDNLWFNLETFRTQVFERRDFEMVVYCQFADDEINIEMGKLMSPREVRVSIQSD